LANDQVIIIHRLSKYNLATAGKHPRAGGNHHFFFFLSVRRLYAELTNALTQGCLSFKERCLACILGEWREDAGEQRVRRCRCTHTVVRFRLSDPQGFFEWVLFRKNEINERGEVSHDKILVETCTENDRT
jgi:hypothetical protein